MKINITINYKDVFAKLLKNFSFVLWVFLGLVILAESFIIKDSLVKVFRLEDQSQFAGSQLIRVNFNAYESIEKRLNENAKFVPPNVDISDPFGLPPSK